MADITALRKYLAASPDMSGMTLDEMRSYLDGIGAKAFLPKGCQVEELVIDHIPAEWIRNSESERTICDPLPPRGRIHYGIAGLPPRAGCLDF